MPLSQEFAERALEALHQHYPHAGDFCFFADLSNLPPILSAGALLSRNAAMRAGLVRTDCAAPSILAQTPAWVNDCVRLYFAPRTPMLYRVEGIKMRPDDWPHCPQPVYLLFGASVLTISGVRVSDGNMASADTYNVDLTEDNFRGLPFNGIYHRGVLPCDPDAVALYGGDPAAWTITRQRHAEVLIPGRLDLAHLRGLVFRSEAEQQLAQFDSPELADRFQSAVLPDWFEPDRMHMESTNENRLSFRNLATGVRLLRVKHAESIVASECRFGARGFTDWSRIDAVDATLHPPQGQSVYYLNGFRVWQKHL